MRQQAFGDLTVGGNQRFVGNSSIYIKIRNYAGYIEHKKNEYTIEIIMLYIQISELFTESLFLVSHSS